MLPYLSVIVSVRNERKMLPGLIDQLLEQNYPAELYEILVADGGSTDGTADLVRRRYSDRRVRVRVVSSPKRSVSAGRNAGIRAASGDAMVFLSGHCRIPSNDLLADTAEILETTGAGCLCRPQPLSAPADTRMGEAIALARSSRVGRGTVAPNLAGFVDPPGFAGTYLRSVFEEVGFFDEGFDACAGMDFNERVRRAGISAYCDPRLAVHEQPPQKLRHLLVEMFRHGRGASRFMRKFPECSSLAEVAPLGVLLAALLTLFAWSQLPVRMAAIVTAPLLLFPGALLIASMQIGSAHGFRSAWRAPLVFATVYLGQGLGLLYEYAFPSGAGKPRKVAPVVTVPRVADAATEVERAA
ncbi:MAG TPA: glycosyltransferase [Acidobacteriaceae bacterium]|jgi:GT2 family glycosyltransferase|nr:glycosyltransferase [Acidobacteriaceae bacterium]